MDKPIGKIKYTCGCILLDMPEYSRVKWAAFKPFCDKHPESGIDWKAVMADGRLRPD